MRVWEPEEIRDICERYENLESLAAIAETYNSYLAAIRKVLVLSGKTIRPKGVPSSPYHRNPERDNEIIARYLAGDTLNAIGDNMGVSRQRVDQILNYYPEVLNTERERRLQEQIRKQFEKQSAKEASRRRVCVLCNQPFQRANRGTTQRFCNLCLPYVQQYYRMTNPSRHEKHRLLIAKNKLRGPSGGPQYNHSVRAVAFWEAHGYLPPPDRTYVFSEKGRYVKEKMGPERWAEVEQRFADYYADTTRRIP